MIVTRRTAREWAIQMLTAADLNPPVDIDAFINDYFLQLRTLEKEDGGTKAHGKFRAFAEELVRGVLGGMKEIDAILTRLLVDWDLYRLGTVERAVMRLGVWEIQHADVPAPVVINEAVDLTNWFSNPKSRTIVNGVLDAYAKERNGAD